MTAINSLLRPDHVLIATDTLATDVRDLGPGYMVPKVFPLPQAQALIASTGSVAALNGVMEEAFKACVDSLDDLLAVIPPTARKLHEQATAYVRLWQPEDDYSWETNGRLFLFGWDDSCGRFVGYSLRARDGFTPERLADGVHLSPASVGRIPHQDVQNAHDLRKAVAFQQYVELDLPERERNIIGGYVVTYQLSLSPAGDVVIAAQRGHRLERYEQDRARCRAKSARPGERWARWEPLLARALRCGEGGQTLEQVRADFLAGRYTLSVMGESAALWEVRTFEGGCRVAHVSLWGGELAEIVGPLRILLEAEARLAGCLVVGLSGRRGLGRVLAPHGYQVTNLQKSVVMKSLEPLP